ncbi:unnamed protein product [Prorocentrum cordatum]|uniref:Uncharacterized protein n=1 Tax=Prorocentrum cordatum TaxID=2364126 RepID=A0ABN9Y449_9DINO|nr:unnamed protein product [Polarella glacialis]
MACKLTPSFEPRVVEKFDKDEIAKNLIDVDFEPFAHAWAALSRLCMAAKGLDIAFLGSRYPEVNKLTLKSLALGGTFISVVSTLRLILVELPSSAKQARTQLLESQLSKVQAAKIPVNLVDYMEKEMKQLQGP